MEATTIRGIDRVNLQRYEAVLNDPDLPVMIPAELHSQIPLAGTPVISGPAGVVVPFDVADPVAVFVWIRGSTDVLDIEAPDLVPDIPGDLLDEDPDDDEAEP